VPSLVMDSVFIHS
jgi:hypothetical protein